jgi:DNA-binding IclR family transcriptional regulator
VTAPRLHQRHWRARHAVTTTPRCRTADVAAALHLDYQQAAQLLQDLAAHGHVARDEHGTWTAHAPGTGTPR